MASTPESELVERELARLRRGATPGEKPACLGVVRFTVTSSHDVVAAVIHCAVEALSRVDENSARWPSDNEWSQILPAGFAARFAPERSVEEAEAWLARWRSLSPQDKRAEEAKQRWSLRDWLYWLEPERREWFWWDAAIVNQGRAVVSLDVKSWPFPWGSFGWLLRAAGADNVMPEGDPSF